MRSARSSNCIATTMTQIESKQFVWIIDLSIKLIFWIILELFYKLRFVMEKNFQWRRRLIIVLTLLVSVYNTASFQVPKQEFMPANTEYSVGWLANISFVERPYVLDSWKISLGWRNPSVGVYPSGDPDMYILMWTARGHITHSGFSLLNCSKALTRCELKHGADYIGTKRHITRKWKWNWNWILDVSLANILSLPTPHPPHYPPSLPLSSTNRVV